MFQQVMTVNVKGSNHFALQAPSHESGLQIAPGFDGQETPVHGSLLQATKLSANFQPVSNCKEIMAIIL